MPPEDPTEELLAEVLARLDDGESDALEEVCARHPEQAPTVRARFEKLRKLDLVAGSAPAEAPDRIGSFRLHECLGGGGMGVVYRAEDEELGREVAVKLIRPDQLYSQAIRERFRRETEILARMQHPCIVPVHSVGTEGGAPYFVMEYVRGATLQEVLDELSGRDPATLDGRAFAQAVARRTPGSTEGAAETTDDAWLFDGNWEETCLRIASQLCEALAHAHERGVLHRDIKPSNVMVTPGGRVFLVDFGLSLFEGTERLTLTQAPVGSLLYMPPELVERREGVDPARGDVYALGVTLHELLALRPPFDLTSAPALLLQIARGERRRLRELSPDASWEAETVCETAMELDPARRYANAAELGRDLRNVLEHRPIEARRAGTLLRLRRLVQRRPTASVAAALGSLLVIGGPLVYAWQERRAGEVIAAVNEDLEDALVTAEANFDTAFEAVQVLLERVGKDDLRDVPQVQEVREELLGLAQDFYGRLIVRAPEDARLQHALASAGVARGRVLDLLGRRAEAIEAFGEEVARLELLLAERPDEGELRQELTHALIELGRSLHMAGATGDSEEAYARAAELLAEADRGGEDERAWARNARSVLQAGQGNLQIKQNAPAEAAETYEAGIASARGQLAADPDSVELQGLLASLLNEYGRMVYRLQGDLAKAEELLLEAQELQARVTFARPDDREEMLGLFNRSLNLAAVQQDMGKLDEAEEAMAVGLEVVAELVVRFPSVPEYQRCLADAHITQGVILYRRQDFDAALDEQLQGLELLQRLSAEHPEDPELTSALGVALSNAGFMQVGLGHHDIGEELLLGAIEAHERSLELVPDHPEYRVFLLKGLHNLITCQIAQDRHTDVPVLSERVTTLQPSAKGLFDLACYLSTCADLAREDSDLDPDDAEATAAAYVALGRGYLESALVADPLVRGRDLDDPRLVPLGIEDLLTVE